MIYLKSYLTKKKYYFIDFSFFKYSEIGLCICITLTVWQNYQNLFEGTFTYTITYAEQQNRRTAEHHKCGELVWKRVPNHPFLVK